MKELSEMSLEELWQLFPISLTCHKNYWASWFEEEKIYLKSILPKSSVYLISHIGSTAIENIFSKPIIDILIEINNSNNLYEIKDILCNYGYTLMNESFNHIALNKGYTKFGFSKRVFHIHLRYKNDNDEVYFCNYLNKYPEIAKEYEKLKLELTKLYKYNRDKYTDCKTNCVKKFTEIARK